MRTICKYFQSDFPLGRELEASRDVGKVFWHADLEEPGIDSRYLYQLKSIERDGNLVFERIIRNCNCHFFEDIKSFTENHSIGFKGKEISSLFNDGKWHNVIIVESVQDSLDLNSIRGRDQLTKIFYFGRRSSSCVRDSLFSRFDPNLSPGGIRGFYDIGRSLTEEDIDQEFCLAAPISFDWSYVGARYKMILKEITEQHFCFRFYEEIGGGDETFWIDSKERRLDRLKYDVPKWVTLEEYKKRKQSEYELNSVFDETPFSRWYSRKKSVANPLYRGFQYPLREDSDDCVYPPNLCSDDPYEILGLSEGCSKKMVKKRYLKLAQVYHPDKNPQSMQSAEKLFKKIQSACDQLLSSSQNLNYDLDPSYSEEEAFMVASKMYNALIKEFLKSSISESQEILHEFEGILNYIENYGPFDEDKPEWLKMERISRAILSSLHIQNQLNEMPIPHSDEEIIKQLNQLDTIWNSEHFIALSDLISHYPKAFQQAHLIFFDKKIALLRMLCELKLQEDEKIAVEKAYHAAIKTIEAVAQAKGKHSQAEFMFIKQATKAQSDPYDFKKKQDFKDFSFTKMDSLVAKGLHVNVSEKTDSEHRPLEVVIKKRKKKKTRFAHLNLFTLMEKNLDLNINYFKDTIPSVSL